MNTVPGNQSNLHIAPILSDRYRLQWDVYSVSKWSHVCQGPCASYTEDISILGHLNLNVLGTPGSKKVVELKGLERKDNYTRTKSPQN